MIRRHLFFVTAAVAAATPIVALAAWVGAPGNPPNSNSNGPVFLQSGTPTAQTGSFNVTGDATVGDDLVFTATGQAIEVNGTATRQLNIGNWGAGSNGLNVGLYGHLFMFPANGSTTAPILTMAGQSRLNVYQICLTNDTCLTTWPSAAAGGGGDMNGLIASTGIAITNPQGPTSTIALGTTYINGSVHDARFVNVTGDTMTGALLVGTSTAAIPSASGIPFVVSGVNRGIDVQLYAPTNANAVALTVTNPQWATGNTARFVSGGNLKVVNIGGPTYGIDVYDSGAGGNPTAGVTSTVVAGTGLYGKGGLWGVVGETVANFDKAGVKGIGRSNAMGVYGVADNRYGVLGESLNGWSGVYGSSTGASAKGVTGFARGTNSQGGYFNGTYAGVEAVGGTVGLTANATAAGGIGVSGVNNSAAGYGGYFSNSAAGGVGAYGGGGTNGFGVYGFSGGATGIGVRGRNGTTDSEGRLGDSGYGVWGLGAPGTSGVGVYGSSGGNGVYGRSTGPSGYYAVYGDATGGYGGVYGEGQVYGGFFRAINGGTAVLGYSDNFSSGTGVAGDGTRYGVVGNAPSPYCGTLTCGNYGVAGYGNAGIRGTGTGVGTSWGVVGSGPIGAEFFTTTPDGIALYTDGWIDVWKDGSGGTTTGVKVRNGLNNSAYMTMSFDGSSWPAIRYGGSGAGAANGLTFQRADGADIMYVTNAGNFTIIGSTATKSAGTTWAVSSDIRLKDVHGNYTHGLSDIIALQPINYTFKKDNGKHIEDTTTMHVGFSAQEVEKVIPEAVSIDKDGYRQLDSDPIMWAMVNSIKELKAENDALKARIEKLEAK